MRIAGVQTGKNRGDVIELSPDQKVVEAVKLAAATAPEFSGFSVTVVEITVAANSFQTQGPLLKKLWANNRYQASGSAKFWFRDQVKDKVHAPKTATWSIEFIDTLDNWKMPDLEVLSFKVD